MSLFRHTVLHWVIGILVGAVFIYASVDKIRHPVAFARIVYHYHLIGPNQHVGPWAANALAVTLPFIEALVGVLLVTGVWRREAAGVAALLLVGFLLAVGAALVRGIDIENCGCFNVTGGGRRAGVLLLLGDGLLLVVALLLATARPSAGASEPGSRRMG